MNFDKDLRKYVGFELEYQRRLLREAYAAGDKSLDPDVEDELIMQRTDEAVYQAMEAFVYNCNTMRSRSGAQVTFSSVNFGTETDWQSRMISKNLLKAYIAGLGNGENPIFPNLCYRLKDGINLHEGEPNFDLTQLAIECVNKRIQPRFVFCDSPAYKGLELSQIGTMGCLARDEVIVYEFDGVTYCEGIGRMTDRLKSALVCQKSGMSNYLKPEGMKIWDHGEFVEVKTVIENPMQQLYHVVFSNGRDIFATLDHAFYVKGKGRIKLEELQIGDEILSDYSAPTVNLNGLSDENYDKMFIANVYDSAEFEYLLGVLTMGNAAEERINVSEKDQEFISHLEYCIETSNCENVAVQLDQSGVLFIAEEVEDLILKSAGTVPQFVFSSEDRIHFLAGAIDIKETTANGKIRLRSGNRELLLQLAMIAQSLDIPVNIYPTQSKTIRSMEFCPSDELLKHLSKKFRDKTYTPIRKTEYIKVVSVHSDQYVPNVYDVETATGHFSASLIQSGNCRTAIRSNVNGDKSPDARGNLAFNTINLPYIALETVEKYGQDIDKFFENLDGAIEDAYNELLSRYDVISNLKPRDVPFVGQWYQNHKALRNSETIEPIVKNGTLSMGFIGLAECLIALTGKHHGESEESQKLGLKIIERIRNTTDQATKLTGLNFSTFASPCESACYTLLKAVVKRFGVIPRISDKQYLTNSFHLPVSFECDAKTKVDVEAPYHLLCNAGAIFYVEVGSSPEPNTEGVLKLLQYIAKSGVVYGGINWTHSFCKVCHHQGSFEGECPVCGSKKIKETKIITGYLSEKERFNEGKVAESDDRISHAG